MRCGTCFQGNESVLKSKEVLPAQTVETKVRSLILSWGHGMPGPEEEVLRLGQDDRGGHGTPRRWR